MNVTDLPTEVQVYLLTYLRAHELSTVQQTCVFYARPTLAHAIVAHAAERVYPKRLTKGFQDEPVLYASSTRMGTTNDDSTSTQATTTTTSTTTTTTTTTPLYTLEHLRNLELLVVARVLSQPEPTTGYVVSKSWCKAALQWLAVQNETRREHSQQRASKKKKISKKKQRLRQRRLSNAVEPPSPNINSDLLCPHNSLQHCASRKTQHARRKLLDKQAWKVLKKLYPESTPLANEECWQCRADLASLQLDQKAAAEHAKQQRKQPLADPVLRRLYTRTKGIPDPAMLSSSSSSSTDNPNAKLPATNTTRSCPLRPGQYYVVPRSWCQGWRRYLKTGDGGKTVVSTNSDTTWTEYPAPDAASLLCQAHCNVLLPPHLEAYLYGHCDSLLGNGAAVGSSNSTATALPPVAAAAARPVGADVDPAALQAMRDAGLSPMEIRHQVSAMRSVQQEQEQQAAAAAAASLQPEDEITKHARLDRENHVVVEIITRSEFVALEKLWPGVFGVSFTVSTNGHVSFRMPFCRECDAVGHCFRQKCTVRGRSARHHVRTTKATRAPASLEY